MRLNRVQPAACRAAITERLGAAIAEQVLAATGIANLPAVLPSGPRDFAALAAELQPFVHLYRELEQRAGRTTALEIARRAIIDSGLASHAAEETSGGQQPQPGAGQPLTLTSPPAHTPNLAPAELESSFNLAMAFFSCQGTLFSYTPDRVHFHVTHCNWCGVLQAAGAPELIPFFCETDEHFMDTHPTHRLMRPTAIGLGHSYCDFQFVPIEDGN